MGDSFKVMQKEHRIVLRIIQSAITEEDTEQLLENEGDGEFSWDLVYKLLCKNSLDGVTYPYVSKLAKEFGPPEKLMDLWKQGVLLKAIRQLRLEKALATVCKSAKEENLELIIMKGITLGHLYPQSEYRFSSDTDLLVSKESREEAKELFMLLGYQYKRQKDNVDEFALGDCHMIELHTSLWEGFTGVKIEQLERLNLTREDRLIKLQVDDYQVTTLGYTEHLVYQIYHIIKHFCLEGIGIRYLVDITLYVNYYFFHIDFKQFWNQMKEVDYDRFCMKIFSICISKFNMNPGCNPNKVSMSSEEEEMLVTDFLSLGSMDEMDNKDWEALNIIAPYFCNPMEGRNGKLLRIVKMICPPKAYLSEEFDYAKKNPILLPIAWVARGCNFHQKKKRNKLKYGLIKKISKAEYRISLMKKAGIIS